MEREVEVRELTLTGLRERTAAAVAAAVAGEAAVVTRHGRPVAMLVPIADRASLAPAMPDPEGLSALAEHYKRRSERRRWSELMHGRWVNGGGIHGPYR